MKIFIGLGLIPICIGVSQGLYEAIVSLKAIGKTHLFFISGIGAYILIHLFVVKFNYLYVLGHESVHAFFAMLFGGKVKSFKVSSGGGSVGTTKTNFIISLAPYFFPIYTAALSLIFLILCFFWKGAYQYTNIFIFSLGFSLSFHFVMTADSLKTKQPDLVDNGYLFSLVLIYIVNIIILIIPLSFLYKEVSLSVFFQSSWVHAKDFAMEVFAQVRIFIKSRLK
ncbi:MAG: hypothetical protein ABII88_04195 [Candidatus Omnitrophota bacterium]